MLLLGKLNMGKKTVLFDCHEKQGAKIVDFSGWDMPINYGSQIEEHHKVRRDVGMFDVSHMTVIDLTGDDAKAFLQHLLANDVEKLKVNGKALYTAMLNENGGVIDDLIVYRRDPGFRLVVNCATREKDIAWMEKQSQAFSVELQERPELSLIAVQGPNAVDKVCGIAEPSIGQAIKDLKPFNSLEHNGWMYCRTGYTGEDGLEIMVPEEQAVEFWEALAQSGVAPCGLGARDTLRLEAGMNLYGTDMDDSISPLEANMAWTVAMTPEERKFIGREALEKQKAEGIKNQLVGLVFRGKGILRGHQEVETPEGKGEITSGSFSPTLGFSIAMARLPVGQYEKAQVMVRGKALDVEVVKPVFVRQGKEVV